MAVRRKHHHGSPDGQAVTEYLILLLIIVGIFAALSQELVKFGIQQKFASLLTQDFKRAYSYGNTQALGYDDPGGPAHHPRIDDGKSDNFRIFIRPGSKN